jgi:site-specific DNA-methyltransferase (adenine-specific)
LVGDEGAKVTGKKERATIERGDNWTMYLGDCIDILPTLEKADHVITDPPYSEHVHRKLGQQARGDGYASRQRLDFGHMTQDLATEVVAKIRWRRWALFFGDEFTMPMWMSALDANHHEYVRKGVWIKPDAMPQMSGDRPSSGFEDICIGHARRERGRMRWNRGGGRAVWTAPQHSSRTEGLGEHPTVKPLPLMLALVKDFTDVGETILDAFAGSGSTGVAALRLARKFAGIESNPKYFALAVERLRAEEAQSTVAAQRGGQVAMFGGSK